MHLMRGVKLAINHIQNCYKNCTYIREIWDYICFTKHRLVNTLQMGSKQFPVLCLIVQTIAFCLCAPKMFTSIF